MLITYFRVPKLYSSGQAFCAICLTHVSFSSTVPLGDDGLELFCTEDGNKLFPDRPELYQKRAQEIRESRDQHYRSDVAPCPYCGERTSLEGEPYCGHCGHRSYPLHWDERAYSDHLRRLREMRKLA